MYDNIQFTVTIVNRASRDEPSATTPEFDGFEPAKEAILTRLESDELDDENTREDLERVMPDKETIAVTDGAAFELPSYSIARLDFERA